jgi:hypothetical protein
MLAAMAGNEGREWHPTAAAAAWGLWGLGTLAFLVTAWLGELHRRVGRGDLVQLTVREALPLLLASVTSATVGAVLVTRRPRHPVGWLLLGLGVSMIVLGAASDYASYALLAGAGPLPGARWAALFADIGWILWPAAIGFVLLLTPTGSPPSPRWRWWVWLAAAAPLAYMLAEALQRSPMDPPFGSVVSPLAVPGPAGGPADRLLQQADGAAAWSSSSRCSWERCRCCCGSAAPAGPSGCSCAGSPWPPSWPGWPRPWWWSAP